MDTGDVILGLGLLRRGQNESEKEIKKLNDQHNRYKFVAKSHVHGLRANLHARQVVEDDLIAALKAENANHPLASREAVEAAYQDERTRSILNPEVIRQTFPDGRLPDGTVVQLEDGSPGVNRIDGVD